MEIIMFQNILYKLNVIFKLLFHGKMEKDILIL